MGCCEVLLKAILIITNVVVMVAGLALLVVGGIFMTKKFDFFPTLEGYSNNVNSILIPMMVIGGILLLVGLIGCIGACTGKAGLLNVYFIAVLLVVLVEIAVIVLVFVKRSDFEEASNKAAKELFSGYYDKFVAKDGSEFDNKKAIAVNGAQYLLECCGLENGPSYWKTDTNQKVPPGCCTGYKGEDSSSENLVICADVELGDTYTVGCKEQLNEVISSMGVVILIIIIAIILFEIVCLVAACISKKNGHMDDYA